MANERLKKRKQNQIYRTAARIIERQNCFTSAGIPYAQAKAMTIHNRRKPYRGKYRPKKR